MVCVTQCDNHDVLVEVRILYMRERKLSGVKESRKKVDIRYRKKGKGREGKRREGKIRKIRKRRKRREENTYTLQILISSSSTFSPSHLLLIHFLPFLHITTYLFTYLPVSVSV